MTAITSSHTLPPTVSIATVVVATAYGAPDVLAVQTHDLPAPAAGQVSIEVRAIGANPFDGSLISGRMGSDPAKLPLRLGLELAGVVTAVGPDAVGPAGPISVGDEVIAYPVSGAYASAVTVAATSVLPKPASAGWEEAAGLLGVGVTASHLLAATAVSAGHRVLVHGVAGSVGSITAQLAIAKGATVIGTAAPQRHDMLHELGIVPVTYGPGLADRVRAAAPDGIDIALDTVGTDEAVDVSLELVTDRRRIATIAAFGRVADGIRVLGGGGPGVEAGTEIRSAARLGLAELLGRGELKVTVARTYPLAQAGEALTFVAAGHAGGKVILLP